MYVTYSTAFNIGFCQHSSSAANFPENFLYGGTIEPSFSPAVEIQKPARRKQNDQITDDERRQNAKIPPTLVEGEAKWFVKLVTNAKGAILTRAGQIIPQVAGTATLKERRHVLSTGLTHRGCKRVEFLRIALHHPIMKLSGDHAAH